jgi:hypothetical protein
MGENVIEFINIETWDAYCGNGDLIDGGFTLTVKEDGEEIKFDII